MHLLKYFDKLSLKPENSKELKGLILNLAIRGRLTEEWREKNPQKKSLPNEISDAPFKLPSSWSWKLLDSISNINGGFAFKSSNYTDQGVRVIRISDFDEKGFKNDKVKRYDYSPDLDKYELEEGNIIMAMTGGTVGKTLFVENLNEKMYVNQRVATIKLDNKVLPDYINCFIQTKLVQDVINEAKNSTNDNISMRNIKGFTVPYPTILEQKAIVQIVNQLMEEVDQLEVQTKARVQLRQDFIQSSLRQLTTANSAEEWKKLQPQFTSFFKTTDSIEKLKEAILQLAVQGKLTKQWRKENPDAEPASALLERIKEEKARLIKEKKIKKEKSLPKLYDDEIPFELPEGWVWCRTNDIVSVGTGATPLKANSSYYGGDIPWFTSSATNKLFADSPDTYITNLALEETNCKVFPKGTLLVAMYGQGKTRGQVTELLIDGASNQAVAALLFHSSSLKCKAYIKYFFRKIYSEIRLLAEGGAQPNLNVGKIKSYLIPLPPLDEQIEIVISLNKLMDSFDQIKNQIARKIIIESNFLKSSIREVMEKTDVIP